MPGGGGGNSNMGGGALGPQNGNAGNGNDQPAKDETKPSPPAEEPDNRFGNDDLAPPNQPATDLTLRGLHDALKDDATARELEQRLNMTKEQLEQFAKKYEKPKVGPGREAKEVELKVGEQPAVGPAANLPGPGTIKFNTDKIRQEGGIPKDMARENIEGVRSQAPVEWRDKWASYTSKLGRIKETPGRRTAKPKPAGGQ
jgi:hypothetical protein